MGAVLVRKKERRYARTAADEDTGINGYTIPGHPYTLRLRKLWPQSAECGGVDDYLEETTLRVYETVAQQESIPSQVSNKGLFNNSDIGV
ncbi:MAG: hypothetical protein GY696_19320, partial [Gammaproteobacteria bacterium]|nr:hypothetical protein [Gammaproteobacteria bacterium]